MAYLRPWDEVFNLLGSRDADEIDDASREGHFDLTQRFDDIIEGGAQADPWRLKQSSLSGDGNAKYLVAAETAVVDSVTEATRGPAYIHPKLANQGILVYFPITYVPGGTLIAWEIRGFRTTAAASVTAHLERTDILAGTSVGLQIMSLDDISASVQIASGDGGRPVMDTSTKAFFVWVSVQAGPTAADTARLISLYYVIQFPTA